MTATKRHRLEVGEDPVFQERSWRAQRFGFVLMLLFVACGALGLFGGGGLLTDSKARAGDVEVDYERFLRFDTSTELDISADGKAEDPFTIEIDRRYADALRIDQTAPPPDSVSADAHADVYEFQTQAGARPVVTIAFSPSRIGHLRGILRVNGQPVLFDQFVYP